LESTSTQQTSSCTGKPTLQTPIDRSIVHAKDGEYPTNGRNLGKETPPGQGCVNIPLVISKLKKLGYAGAITIEREIAGPQQTRDIKKTKVFLEKTC
jgi:L-ribulose-5-phosphate 3-epimerase